MKFSDRLGFTTPKNLLQIESMDDELTLKIWNAIYNGFLASERQTRLINISYDFRVFMNDIWGNFLNFRLNEFPNYVVEFINKLEEHYFKIDWYERYNFVEFIAGTDYLDSEYDNKNFTNEINNILKTQLSGYRLANNLIIPITNDLEMSSINNSLELIDKFPGVRHHLKTSMELLSNKTTPDYRNSIKESISAVESIASILADKPKATLGEALKVIETKHQLHKALKDSFDKLYGYTSDAEGIRHKLLDDKVNVEQADAIYMLVSCSAFINYLISKFIAN